ncbi:MAG: cell surface protein SprA, partial [Paludibacteraceae bacterium]|nr:cell surface protein SprA [Paludibacteraceae bacterium]
SSVSIEENDTKTPVNYVLPPGVSRELDPSQQQVRQENEQSMTLKVINLHPKDARAVYKKLGGYDMRQYGRIQLFTHAEALPDDVTDLRDNDLTVFIRLGSDYKSNYYEYEVPLKVTQPGLYSNNTTADRREVWPDQNLMDFPLSLLTDLKTARNTEKVRSGSSVSNATVYSTVDPEHPTNKVSIVGNPTLGDVEVVMIGVRNASKSIQSGEIWVDELLLTDFDQNGGVAAIASMDLALSDFITLNASGRVETIGFGGIEDQVSERRQEDYYQYSVNAGVDLGKLFPEKANVVMPVRYSMSQEISNPKYNPIDKDILLSESLAAAASRAERDSIRNMTQDRSLNQSLSIPSIRVGIVGKDGPRPWDPANFTIGGSYSQTESQDPNTAREIVQYSNAFGSYEFSWTPKPVEPFGKIKALRRSKNWKWIADWGFNYAPKQFSYKTSFTRNYYELQQRDYADLSLQMDPTFQKDFRWNNDFDIAWDITKNIKLSLTISKEARITENEGGVNKWLYPDEYEAWKDSVWGSLRHLGSPMDYHHEYMASWAVPFSKIPFLNWLSANVKYTGTYSWLYGNETIYNTANSTGVWQGDAKINFETLYNKSAYAKNVNRKYGSSRGNNRTSSSRKPKSFSQSYQVQKGDTVTVRHRLNNKTLQVSATRNGKKMRLRYKTIDNNTFSFVAKEAGDIAVQVSTGGGEVPSHPVGDFAARFGMMLRNVSANYSRTDGTVLPGFKPTVTVFGLTKYNGEVAPGGKFIFGGQEDDFLERALRNGWLETSSAIFNPAQFIHSETFKATALVEPFPGFKINLAVDRQYVSNRGVQFTSDERLSTLDGSLSMSYIAIGTSFARMNKSGEYKSELFDRFLANREVIKTSLQEQYSPTLPYQLNSDDVLVPAFLAAYSGRDVNKVKTKAIPAFWSFLPNWQV